MNEWPDRWFRPGDRGRAQPDETPSGEAGGATQRVSPVAAESTSVGLPPELDPRDGRPSRHAAPPASAARTPKPFAAAPPFPPAAPPQPPPQAPPPTPPGPVPPALPRRGRRRGRMLAGLLALVLLAVVLFYAGLAAWGTSRLNKISVLSGARDTAGSTWLIVGSDSREGLSDAQKKALHTGSSAGRRTDTIMLMHIPNSGQPTLVSLPRDSYVRIEGHRRNKLNAAFSFGGPKLLVDTVENATGLTIDHYAEIGFGGVVGVVDALGGVRICVNSAITDEKSGLNVKAGCQTMSGATSLAFVRARYFDPTGDLGRIRRQQQFVSAVSNKVFSAGTVLNPARQVALVRAGTDAVVVDSKTGALDLLTLARKFRAITAGKGTVTTVPVADPDYHPGGVGSTVLWDRRKAAQFFADLEAGKKVSATSTS